MSGDHNNNKTSVDCEIIVKCLLLTKNNVIALLLITQHSSEWNATALYLS